MDLGRRFLDGFFATALVFLGLSMSKGFANIISSGTAGFGTLFKDITGQNASPFFRPQQ